MKMKFVGITLTLVLGTSILAVGLSKEPINDSEVRIEKQQKVDSHGTARSSVEEARRQAAALHSAMHATIQVVHHRYYREDEGLPIPASIMKDVFAEIETDQQIKLRWLVVEGQAMNLDHRPQDEFERHAVEALKSGKRSFESTENGFYRHAGAITLTSQCLKCHVPDRKNTKNRTAGLVISIPIKVD